MRAGCERAARIDTSLLWAEPSVLYNIIQAILLYTSTCAQRGGLNQLAGGELARRMFDPCARAASTCMATMARSGVRQV